MCEYFGRHYLSVHGGFAIYGCEPCLYYEEICLEDHVLDDCEICDRYREHLEPIGDNGLLEPCICPLCIYYRRWITHEGGS